MKRKLIITLNDLSMHNIDISGINLLIGAKVTDPQVTALMEEFATKGFRATADNGNPRYIAPGFIKFIDVEFN